MIGLLVSKLGVKGIALILGAFVISLVVGAAVLHYQALVRDNAILTANNALLTTAVETQRLANARAVARIDDFAEALRYQQITMDELAIQTHEAAAMMRKVDDIFAKHDFQKLLDGTQASMVVRRVNSGTRDIYKLLECATVAGGCGSTDATGSDDPGSP